MACGDVLSLEDLQTAKKHQIFEAEVITGKAGGVAGGADIPAATNQVTGQVQTTLPEALKAVGFKPAQFTFVTGGALTGHDYNLSIYNPSPNGDNNWYAWGGALPKTIPANSTPQTTGGFGPNAWFPINIKDAVTEFNSRSDLVAAIPLGNVVNGNLVVAGGLFYQKVTGSTAISDLPGLEPHGEAHPEHWGAPGGGVINEIPFFQQAMNWLALDPNRKLTEINNVTRLFTGGLVTSGHLNFDMGQAKYIVDYNGYFIDANGNANPTFYPLTAEYVVGSVNVPVAPLPAAPKQGDWVRIISNAYNPNDRVNAGKPSAYRVQEYARVGIGSTTTNIVLETPLRFHEGVNYEETALVNAYSPTWNARVVLVDVSKKFEVAGGSIRYPDGKTYGPYTIKCTAYYKPKFKFIDFNHLYGSGINTDGTLFADIYRCTGNDFADNNPAGQNGYVINDGGYFTKVRHCIFGKARHGYTTLRMALSNDTLNAFSGGNTVGGRVLGCEAYGCTTGHFNAHHGAVDIRFIDCHAEGGSDNAFGGRGLDCWVIGCKSRGILGSGLKWIRESGGISGGFDKYAPSVTVVDSDLFGDNQTFTAQYAKVVLRDTIFRSNKTRQLVATASDVTIQGVVKFIADSMNGTFPIVESAASYPVYIYEADGWLAGSNRVRVESGALLDLSFGALASISGHTIIIGSNCEFQLLGKLSVDVPDGTSLLNSSLAARVISLPTSEIEVPASKAATILFGGLTNKAKAYTSLGVALISGIEFHGPAGDGFVIKEPSGAMIAYGDKVLGSRINAGTGTFADPYTTPTATVTFGVTFIAAPSVTFQHKVTAGAAADTRRGGISCDNITTTVASFVRGNSASSSATDTTVSALYHAIGRWK